MAQTMHEDLRRRARRFELEQSLVDEFGEARLVLLDAEPGGSRQVVIGNEGEVLRRAALAGERQQKISSARNPSTRLSSKAVKQAL